MIQEAGSAPRHREQSYGPAHTHRIKYTSETCSFCGSKKLCASNWTRCATSGGKVAFQNCERVPPDPSVSSPAHHLSPCLARQLTSLPC